MINGLYQWNYMKTQAMQIYQLVERFPGLLTGIES